jgi:hypothetical protein
MKKLLVLGLVAALAGVTGCQTAARPKAVAVLNAQQPDGEFAGWKSFHEQPGTKTADVWQLQPGGVLVCKGTPRGYLYTEQDYTDFKIEFEWRYPPGATQSNGGLLLRMTGEHAVWPKCLEFQLNQTQAGDFWGIRGFTYAGPESRYRIITNSPYGTLRHLKRTLGMERPAGQWNRFEGIAAGDTVVQKINHVKVNEAVGCDVVPGKILITAEGQEIQFRNIRLTPLR